MLLESSKQYMRYFFVIIALIVVQILTVNGFSPVPDDITKAPIGLYAYFNSLNANRTLLFTFMFF